MDILYIERQEDRILEAFVRDDRPNKSILLVEGARQVGKTALVQNTLQKSSMPTSAVNLERDSLLQSEIDESKDFYEFQDLLQDRLGFEGGSRSIIFFDEAQESRKLGRYVRFMKEEWEKTTTILSGSTLRRLFRPDTRYPVGRVRRLVLWPFAFSEYLKAGGGKNIWRWRSSRCHPAYPRNDIRLCFHSTINISRQAVCLQSCRPISPQRTITGVALKS